MVRGNLSVSTVTLSFRTRDKVVWCPEGFMMTDFCLPKGRLD